jgi:hypothetical protein
MPSFDTDLSLQRLTSIVPPPPTPLEVERQPASLFFAGGQPVEFPPDYLALVDKYGSGWFDQDGEVGMIAKVFNPRAAAYQNVIEHEHGFLREYKAEWGDGYQAYDIYPTTPGLLEWGWAAGRHAYFWLTEGLPAQWPLIVMWDFDFFGRYDMPLVVFLERLVAGELDARFLRGVPMRLDPTRITFVPQGMPWR